jgi:hypothetical protein
MRNKYMLVGVGVVVGVLLSSAVFVLAGNVDSPGAPGATNSYTLEDIYNRLDTGAAGTQSTFTEPGVAPGTGTMHTLNEIYDLIGDGGGAGVPKTGQTTKYADGDDGDLQKGVAWPVPRFTDNGDGTVTDNLTGLIWLKNANCFSTQTWANALSAANTLNSGECSLTDGSNEGDWRLPNVRELYSLIDFSQHNPALPSGHPFTGVQSAIYWSSATAADGTGSAWEVSLIRGNVISGAKTCSVSVWPVRGGQ